MVSLDKKNRIQGGVALRDKELRKRVCVWERVKAILKKITRVLVILASIKQAMMMFLNLTQSKNLQKGILKYFVLSLTSTIF